MPAKFPEGTTFKHELVLPEGGGWLIVQDNDGNEIRRWAIKDIVDDWNKPIAGAKYEVAIGPVAIEAPQDTHR